MKKLKFNLHLFDEVGSGVADNAANDADLQEQNSAVDTENPVAQGDEEASKPSFDDLINGEYKKDYQKNINKVVRSRLKGAKETEDKLNSYTPLLEMLANRYGMDATDVSKLNAQDFISKMMDDDSIYEEESYQKNIPVETLKQIKKMELENATMKRQLEERALEEQRQREFTAKMQEAEELKEFYPNFDFTQELQIANEGDETAQQFMRLLGNGVPMKLAFEVTHPELITNAMKAVAQTASEKVANSVKANSKRPSEGGSGLSGGTPARLNPATMTEKQIRELRERALSGERIVL